MIKFFNKCLYCKNKADKQRNLCSPCYQSLPWLEGHFCQNCLLPLDSLNIETCGDCLARPKSFERLYAGFEYRDLVHHSVVQYKFKQQLIHGRLLADGWLQQRSSQFEKPDLIVPVPLHWRRQLKRGFNQSAVLAKYWGKQLGVPASNCHLHRIRATTAQMTLKREQRLTNLKGAFSVAEHPFPKHIAIVDDVYTTGSTVQAIAKQIRQHTGVERIDIWVLARRMLAK